MKAKKHNNISGFSLIELAVALIIIGLVMGAFFSAASIYVKQKRAEDMVVRYNDIRVALAEYTKDDPNDAADEVRYPCPAPLTNNIGDAGFGEELCPADYSAVVAGDDLGGVFVVNGTSPGTFALIGSIPTATLNANNDLMFDEYGNRFTYAVTLDLTETDALLSRPVPAGQIEVVDQDDNVKTSSADFIIVSHGEDGSGAYSSHGVRVGNCRLTDPVGAGDSRNCMWQTALEAIFKDQKGYGLSTANNDSYFDDSSVYQLGEDKGWWQASGGAGNNIISKNPANIGIGPGISEPVQRLDVDGAIKVSNTANTCDASSVGSIRYNDGGEAVVECCNGNATDGYAWNDIAYGCASGECTPDNLGQQRFNFVTLMPEFCNGSEFVQMSGASCEDDEGNEYYHLQQFEEEETEETECDQDLFGDMSRSRSLSKMCNNGTIEDINIGDWSAYDRSNCLTVQESCEAWYDAGIRESGIYPVDSDGDGTAEEVYCLMTDGGWTRLATMSSPARTYRSARGTIPFNEVLITNHSGNIDGWNGDGCGRNDFGGAWFTTNTGRRFRSTNGAFGGSGNKDYYTVYFGDGEAAGVVGSYPVGDNCGSVSATIYIR
jgi:prepilin-type N-terminal cleavage/methylation domain-containing protein